MHDISWTSVWTSVLSENFSGSPRNSICKYRKSFKFWLLVFYSFYVLHSWSHLSFPKLQMTLKWMSPCHSGPRIFLHLSARYFNSNNTISSFAFLLQICPLSWLLPSNETFFPIATLFFLSPIIEDYKSNNYNIMLCLCRAPFLIKLFSKCYFPVLFKNPQVTLFFQNY